MKNLFITVFSFLVFNFSFSQEKITTFFSIKSVNGVPAKGTLLANPEYKIKLKIGSEKIVSREVYLGDNLEDQYTLYFTDKISEYKAVFFANQIKIYKSIIGEYNLIYDIETYETNLCFVK